MWGLVASESDLVRDCLGVGGRSTLLWWLEEAGTARPSISAASCSRRRGGDEDDALTSFAPVRMSLSCDPNSLLFRIASSRACASLSFSAIDAARLLSSWAASHSTYGATTGLGLVVAMDAVLSVCIYMAMCGLELAYPV